MNSFMKSMRMNGIYRKIHFLVLCVLLCGNSIFGEEVNYRRCSLTQMLISHPMYPFGDEITAAFKKIPWNNRFNNHDLGVKVVKFSTQEYTDQTREITKFLLEANVANRSVAKWFHWDRTTGKFDVSLIRERGLYDASELNRQIASISVRGSSILEDAGEALIPKTFLIMHDLCFKGNYSNKKEDVIKVGTKNSFSVKVVSYIFQLDWPSGTIEDFYFQHYAGNLNFIEEGKYSYSFRAKVESEVKETSEKMSQDNLIKLVVGRALDVNIAKLMKVYEDFRIMFPIVSVSPITSYIGLKEGITNDSRFEVLEIETKDSGIQKYIRRGIVRVKPGTIMDNRYSPYEKLDTNLSPTEFIVESGSGFYPGMLLREI